MPSLLIACTPVHGHVQPLLAVARHLIGHGHRVRFLTGERYRSAVEATGAEYLALPRDIDYDDSDVDAAFPDRVGRTGVAGIRWDVENIFLAPAPLQLAALDEAIAAEQTDAVLVESMFVGAVALVSRPRGERPPVVNLGIIPLGLSSVDTAPFGLGIAPMPGLRGRIRNRALRFVAEHVIFGALQRSAQRMVRETTGHELEGFFLGSAALADAVVQFTVPEFEYPRSDLPEHVHFVGPVARSRPSSAALPEWWGDLDGSRPVVHVTQGTVANADLGALIVPTVEALASDDVLVVVSTGGRPLTDLPALPSNVRAAEYLPYDALLPLTDVVVTNGGYGGVHYAMEHGVPLVVAGTTEDKIEVSARVAWSGVGIDLRTERPTTDAVRRAVRTALADPSYRAASERVGAAIRASAGLDGLDEVLMDLIARAPAAG
ncbi:glycosyltransferase [Agromyces atrinae]|uniref:Glycosyltransferase n=1 Tax=Agromyces atrinae TaxID=592376 RepID=A0A4Q2M9W0_9MICO|nr:nucleotide disphospho-sugar-binding domain-containing protein [Agromyces atrinae]NYD67605.1 UDP:flavonoid glycosyltransferase YjiC (YdhE family) [Agromyces atrinae]RXZ88187.1 glycosyltransferase [Agromyces atrinae]